MSLSWKTGTPIARIEGGEYAKRILYANSDPITMEKVTNNFITDIIPESWIRLRKKRIRQDELNRIYKALFRKTPPDDDELRAIYTEAVALIRNSLGSEVNLMSGRFIPLPQKVDLSEKDISKRPSSRMYITGPTNCGKSTFASKYIRELQNRHNKPIYVFSVLPDDEPIDKLGPKRIRLDEELIKEPIELSELKNSIVVFDDIDTIKNKKLKESVQNLRDTCLSEGRHYNISTICTSHVF